jgi:hypothetical protein
VSHETIYKCLYVQGRGHLRADLNKRLSTKRTARKSRGRAAGLAYPNPARLAEVLADPDVKAVLAPEFRPAGAEKAGARHRVRLSGEFAGATPTVVHLTL